MARPTKRQQTNKKISESMTKDNPDIVRKLEEAFSIDASVEEACYYADISRETYYRWTKENPDLYDKFTRLRNRPILLARQTVVNKLKDSYYNSMDFLKRKKKLEFGDNMDVTSAGDKLENNTVNLTDEQLRNIAKGSGRRVGSEGVSQKKPA